MVEKLVADDTLQVLKHVLAEGTPLTIALQKVQLIAALTELQEHRRAQGVWLTKGEAATVFVYLPQGQLRHRGYGNVEELEALRAKLRLAGEGRAAER